MMLQNIDDNSHEDTHGKNRETKGTTTRTTHNDNIWYWHILTDFKGVERPKFGDLKIPGNGWCSNDLFLGDLGPHPFLAWLNRSWCILASLRWPSSCTLSALTKKSCVRMSSVNLYNYSSFPKKNISWKTVCPIKNSDFLWLLPILYIKIQTEITNRLQPHLVLENLMMSATQRGPGSDGQGGEGKAAKHVDLWCGKWS